jgi:hypothetical protein
LNETWLALPLGVADFVAIISWRESAAVPCLAAILLRKQRVELQFLLQNLGFLPLKHELLVHDRLSDFVLLLSLSIK